MHNFQSYQLKMKLNGYLQYIIMDQFSFNISRKHLSSIFEEKFKKEKKFTQIIENKHTLMLITSFLSVPDIINFSLTCKDIHKVVEKNPTLQNKILRAQVAYLTNQEQKSLKNSPFSKNQSDSAYTLIQSYYESFSPRIDLRFADLHTGKAMLSNSILANIFKLRAELQKKTLQKTNNQKIIGTQKQQIQENKKINSTSNVPKTSLSSQPSIEIIGDKELQLLTRWQKMAEEKQRNERYKKFLQMSKEQKRNFMIEKFKQYNVPYLQRDELGEASTRTGTTFLDRLRNRFMN